MPTLHVATFDYETLRELLPSATRLMGAKDSPSEWRFTNGDQWEEWGEGLEPESGQPEHVIVQHDNSTELITDVAYVMNEAPTLLQPMTFPNQAGTLAAITQDDEWSECLWTIEDAQSARFISNLVYDGANPNEMWLNPEWRARQGL